MIPKADMSKPISEPCLRNQSPILLVLETYFSSPGSVLELGCGTGQHAVFMAKNLPHLHWLPTDLAPAVTGAELWVKDAKQPNLANPKVLDVETTDWPLANNSLQKWDYLYTSNTLHFVSWSKVEAIFRGASQCIKPEGVMAVYGPFNDQGFTSEGNVQLNNWVITEVDPEAGLKEVEDVQSTAEKYQFKLIDQLQMPANNQMLIFSYSPESSN